MKNRPIFVAFLSVQYVEKRIGNCLRTLTVTRFDFVWRQNMKDFVLAALPWVLAGLAVAIICAGMGTRKSEKKEKETEQHIAIGLSLGLLFGVALNGCGLWDNHAIGFALGPLWGMALATLFDNRNKNDDEGKSE